MPQGVSAEAERRESRQVVHAMLLVRSGPYDLSQKPYSYRRQTIRGDHFHFLGQGFRVGCYGFAMGVLVYGFEYAIFL